MTTTVPSSSEIGDGHDGGRDSGSRPLLRRVRRRVPVAVWYAAAAFGVAVVVVLVQLAAYTHGRQPRDAAAIVEREFNLNTLQPGERVVRSVAVFRRDPADYFRATQGLLVLTDRRLVYLGAPPRDMTGAADQPPAFDQREFRIDTLVRLVPTFSALSFARAIKIETPGPNGVKLAVHSESWPKAKVLTDAWAARHQKLRAIGVWGKRVREARAALGEELARYRKQPVYHVVRPGDAISSIASWYETSVDSIRRLNNIVDNKIRVGQRLLIRAGSS
jgi:hypothetical protein